jgi:hypothetical protein
VKKLRVPRIKQQILEKKPKLEAQSGENNRADIAAQLRKMRKSLEWGIVEVAKQVGISSAF